MVYYSFFVTSENIKENFIVIKTKTANLLFHIALHVAAQI